MNLFELIKTRYLKSCIVLGEILGSDPKALFFFSLKTNSREEKQKKSETSNDGLKLITRKGDDGYRRFKQAQPV